MRKIYEVGEVIQFDKFAFPNKEGGTGCSDWMFDEMYKGLAFGVITKAWEDYECGWRFHCEPLYIDLVEYLERNSSHMIVYVSEFDIIE